MATSPWILTLDGTRLLNPAHIIDFYTQYQGNDDDDDKVVIFAERADHRRYPVSQHSSLDFAKEQLRQLQHILKGKE